MFDSSFKKRAICTRLNIVSFLAKRECHTSGEPFAYINFQFRNTEAHFCPSDASRRNNAICYWYRARFRSFFQLTVIHVGFVIFESIRTDVFLNSNFFAGSFARRWPSDGYKKQKEKLVYVKLSYAAFLIPLTFHVQLLMYVTKIWRTSTSSCWASSSFFCHGLSNIWVTIV